MSFIDDELAAMYDGPLAIDVSGPDGVVRGFFDQADEENWRIGDLGGRTQTRLDRHTVVSVQTSDMGTIARQSLVTIDGDGFRVQDTRRKSDGRETTLYLVGVA